MHFYVTDHAFEKHLYNCYEGASMFYSEHIMMYCISQCVKQVDRKCKLNTKQILEYKFNFVVGCMSNGKLVNNIRMIYKLQKRRIVVVTIYPIK